MFEVPSVNSKDQFLEQAKAAREERAFERKKESAALTIQVWHCNAIFHTLQIVIMNFVDNMWEIQVHA